MVLTVVPSFLLAPSSPALMAVLHACAQGSRRIWTQLGVSLATVYAAVIGLNYFLQLTVVWQNLLSQMVAPGSANPLVLGGLLFWCLAFPVAAILLVVLFKHGRPAGVREEA